MFYYVIQTFMLVFIEKLENPLGYIFFSLLRVIYHLPNRFLLESNVKCDTFMYYVINIRDTNDSMNVCIEIICLIYESYYTIGDVHQIKNAISPRTRTNNK